MPDDGLYESLRKSHRAGDFRRRLNEAGGVTPETESDLIKVVEDDSLPFQSRTVAVAALGRAGVSKAVPAIRGAIATAKSGQADLMYASIVALYRLQGHGADDVYEAALNSKSEAIRHYADNTLTDAEAIRLLTGQ